jgi:hypothetical protein
MAPEERSEIVQALEDSRKEFCAAVEGVSEEHAKICPAAGRWSVLECVEHVAVVEQRFLSRLEAADQPPPPPLDKHKEAELAVRVTDRTGRAQAPEPVQPSGRFLSLAQALEHFNAARTRTIDFANARCGDLYQLAWEHPRFGPLNGTEVLVITAGHARRHAAQIREVRNAINA